MKTKTFRQRARRVGEIIFDLSRRHSEHHTTAYSAQMAYFFMLSIFPMLIFLFMVASRLDMVSQLRDSDLLKTLPEHINNLLLGFIDQMKFTEGNTVLSIAGLGTLYAASRAVTALQRAMNAVYEIKETRHFIKVKLTGMLYTLLFIIMIVLTLLIPNIGYKLLLWIQNNLFVYFNVDLLSFFSWGRNILLLGLYILLFGTIYSKLPNRRIKLKDAYYGAIFALVGTIIENIVFSNIVVKLTDYTVLYGSLSVVIAFMVWLYIWGIIIMTGAEINAMIWERREQMMGEDAQPTAVGRD